MLRVITVILTLVVCCYCANDSELLTQDARAKKKKANVRLWVMILLFIFSKVAIFKVGSVMLFMAVFQKLISLAGVAFTYFMKQKAESKPMTPPAPPMYGPPSEYNTIGYSYGPPENENAYPGHDYGVPSLTEMSDSVHNWLHKGKAK